MEASRLAEEVSMAATIRLRTAQFRKFAKLKGWTSDDQAATELGVHPATLSRVLHGRTAPGERFIAACLSTFAGTLEFSDLFEVVGDSEDVA
jgi:transcriptional regulator with XRE-family HTH domain